MSLFQINAINTPMYEVDYMGGTIMIPVGHKYIAMTKLDCSNGETKGLLVSYEEEPTVSRNGYYVAVPGTEHRILGEVEYRDPRGSLRKVADLTRDEAILANAEELTYKFVAAKEQADSPEELIHMLFCPEHGVLVDFLAHSSGMLADFFNEDNQ